MNHYHIYNRGAHKSPIFHDEPDYHRFLKLLFISNDSKPRRVDLRYIEATKLYRLDRNILVEIFAYCLMPNHFHIGLIVDEQKNITKFMHKLCTAYSMYYNKKYKHSGTIFQGQYKSRYVDNEEYLRYLIQYIHLNPYSIKVSDMTKSTKADHIPEAIEYSKSYDYSSYKDYLGKNRDQKTIITSFGGLPFEK